MLQLYPTPNQPASRRTLGAFKRARKAAARYQRLRALGATDSVQAMAHKCALELSLSAYRSQTTDIRAQGEAVLSRWINFSTRRVGGLRFFRLGRFNLSFSVSRA